MKLLKTKWNVKSFDRPLIARLLSELEGASYYLDCIDQSDYDILKKMANKYYSIYFSIK